MNHNARIRNNRRAGVIDQVGIAFYSNAAAGTEPGDGVCIDSHFNRTAIASNGQGLIVIHDDDRA
jgi:hypothetical protein